MSPAERTRVSRADYIARAMELLEERGYESVTAAGLCDELGVSRGSFYHHFGSFGDFVDALLAHWEAEYTDRMAFLAGEPADAQTRALTRIKLAVGLPHGAEAALRNWAVVNPAVEAGVKRVDAHRHAAMTASLRADGLPKNKAELLSSMAFSILVGMQQRQRPVDTDALNEMFTLFTEMARSQSW